LFCGHKLPNRTQIIQHLMAKHFRYFPHECGEWYVLSLEMWVLLTCPIAMRRFVARQIS
jgi:hypothetical protein